MVCPFPYTRSRVYHFHFAPVNSHGEENGGIEEAVQQHGSRPSLVSMWKRKICRRKTRLSPTRGTRQSQSFLRIKAHGPECIGPHFKDWCGQSESRTWRQKKYPRR